MKLVPKNWVDFQHYKDRAPPWIKLHKGLLDDSVFQRLPVASRALAPMLWLLASEEKTGEFNASLSELAFRLRQTEKDVDAALKPLISNGFFVVVQSDSDALAECKQDAMPEERRDRGRDRVEETPPDGVSPSVWADFQKLRKTKKAPVTKTAVDGIKREADRAGLSLEAALAVCCQRGWTGFKADWMAQPVSRNDVAAVTVPSRQGVDPALAKLILDAGKAKPPSDEIRAKMAAMRG